MRSLRSPFLVLILLGGCESASIPVMVPEAGGSASASPDGAAPIQPAPDAGPDTQLPLFPDAEGTRTPDPDLREDAGPVLVLDAARDVKPPVDLRLPVFPDAPPPPPPNPDARLLVPGRARLVGTHFTACSNAVPASGTGDRWCAFSLPNRQIGLTDLWVINLTKVLASPTPPKCDGTDPNCKLLVPPGGNPAQGTQLWTGQPMQGPIYPTTHRFDGDTLVFNALAPEAQDQYAGPIFAWRPGWDAPKQISMTKTAYSCSAHFTAETFVCIENLTTAMPLQFDLTGGALSAPGKLIKHIVPFRAGSQSSQWRASLTRAGDSLAFSTGGLTVAERETLYVARLTDATPTATLVKAGVSRWSISADGTKVYFLANYNYDTMGAPAGTMTMMDFPSGANEKTLAPMVGAIQVLAEGEVDKGIGYFDSVLAGKATYKIIKDRNVPSAITTVITNIGGVLAMSRDLRFLYFYKDFNMDNGSTTDGYIAKTDGSMETCSLTTTLESDQFGAPFTQNGSMVFWADNIDQIDGVGEGWMANPDPTGRNMMGCNGRRKWSDKMDFWFLRANDGMIFSDEGMLDYSSLKFVPFPGGNSLGAPTLVSQQVNRIYAVIPDLKALLYTVVNASAASDGLIAHTKLPF